MGLRQGRILRLVDEALDQGGVLTEEDLARVLQVTLQRYYSSLILGRRSHFSASITR